MSLRWNKKAARWYLDGEPVHAGAWVEIQGTVEHPDLEARALGQTVPGEWFGVRVESRDQGRELDAYVTIHGLTFKRHLAGFNAHSGLVSRKFLVPWSFDPIRWPPKE